MNESRRWDTVRRLVYVGPMPPRTCRHDPAHHYTTGPERRFRCRICERIRKREWRASLTGQALAAYRENERITRTARKRRQRERERADR